MNERSESRVEDTLFEPQSSRSRAYCVAAVAVAVSVLAVVAVVTSIFFLTLMVRLIDKIASLISFPYIDDTPD